MPNWCENELTIAIDKKGHPRDRNKRLKYLENFIKFARDPDYPDVHISADRFIPYPKEWKILDKKHREVADKIDALPKEERIEWYKNNKLPEDGYNHGGYDWCCENWGSKWNLADTTPAEEIEPGKILYKFSTAWSPPCPTIIKMSEMFQELIFTLQYWECGMAFRGTFKVKDGAILIDKSSKYSGGRGG